MGMLGAMAGMGKGLQDFSTLLNEKSKMDWMAQQEAVKHERMLSLESLRNQNQMNLVDKQQGFQKGERVAGQEFLAGEKRIEETNANARASSAEALAYEQMNRADARVDKENELALRRIGAEKAAQLNTAAKIHEMQEGWSDKDKLKQKELIDKSPVFSPGEKELLKLSVENKEVAAAYVSMTKSGLDDKAMAEYAKTYRESLNAWETGALPQDAKEALQVKMLKSGIKDPTEQAFAYAETVAQQSVGGRSPGKPKGGMLGGPKVVEEPSSVSRDINMNAVLKVASAVNSGDLTKAQVMADTTITEEEKGLILQEIGKGTKSVPRASPGRSTTPMQISGQSAARPFASNIPPEGEAFNPSSLIPERVRKDYRDRQNRMNK